MTDTTTIQVDTAIRDELDTRKQGDESYNSVLQRVLGESGELWTEDEIRTLIRQEVEKQLRMQSGF